MNKSIRYLACFALTIIMLMSLYVAYKIKKQSEPDKKTAEEIYEETEEFEKKIVSVSEQLNEDEKSENKNYRIDAMLKISKLNIVYPIINETTMEYLKIAPCKFFGPNPNENGNYCIIGHNNLNDEQFSNLDKLNNGDVISLTNKSGYEVNYTIYDKYVVEATDLSCTTQNIRNDKEITLITCTDNAKRRLILKAKG